MSELGYTCLLLGLCLSLYGIIGNLVGILTNSPELIISSRRSIYMTTLSVSISVIALIYLFISNDFSVKYVHDHSNLAMDKSYVWVAFYSGNEGSLLYITFILTFASSIVIRFSKLKNKDIIPWSSTILSGVIFFYILVLAFFANPFEHMNKEVVDGIGINPLLLHPGMFSHPPMLMAGLAIITIPFAFANGSLINGNKLDDWVDIGRITTLLSWGILGIGMLLGAWWAYTILGWGGYWSWDPIENVALMPWLALTAFIHSIMVQKRRGMFQIWNIILLNIAFILAQFGTFINRGGPVVSVHSFASSTLGYIFFGFLIFSLIFSFTIFFWRIPKIRSERNMESFLSREASFLINNFLLLCITFITLWGVIYPVFSDVIRDISVTVAAPYFNRTNGPLLILLVLVMGIGPLLNWRKSDPKQLINKIIFPLIISLLIIFILLILIGLEKYLAAIAFGSLSFAITSIFQDWFQNTKIRISSGDNKFFAWWNLINSNRPRHGGYIVHISIIMIGMGVIGTNFFDQRTDQAIFLEESIVLDNYRIEYIDLIENTKPDRITSSAYMNIYKINPSEYEEYYEEESNGYKIPKNISGNNDKKIGNIILKHEFFPSFNQISVRSGILSTPIEDLYVIPRDFLEDGRIGLAVSINPLASWLWISGPFFIFGTIFALWPAGRNKNKLISK